MNPDMETPMDTLSPGWKCLLVAAILVPVAYFGAQVLAAPYFPNYSILTTSASDLGSDLSSRPGILNSGALLTGMLALLGSAGLAGSLPRIGAGKLAACALALCVASAGLASLWAGWHPLPSPRHDPGALGAGMFVAPFAAVWAAWRLSPTGTLRWALSLNAIAFVALAAVMFGVGAVDLSACRGLVQKLLAVASFLPSAVIAAIAIRRSGRRTSAIR